MIRIGLNHEDALVLDGLKRVLSAESDMQVVSTTSRVADMLAQAGIERPEVLILDAVLADADILDVIAQAQSLSSSPNLLIVSTLTDATRISEILSAGALGFYSRCDDPALIPAAVRAVAAGLPSVSPLIRQMLLDQLPAGQPKQELPHFSKRESDVLRLLAKGLPRQQIATELSISDSTLRDYLDSLRHKTGLETREEMIVYAVQNGFGD